MTGRNFRNGFNSDEEMIAAEMKSFVDAKMKEGQTGVVLTMIGTSDEQVANMLSMFPGAKVVR